MRILQAEVMEIKAIGDQRSFFCLKFFGDFDVHTEGLFCFASLGQPKHLVVAESLANEKAWSRGSQKERDAVLLRASKETGIVDLVCPEIVRIIDRTRLRDGETFQDFRKRLKPPTVVYRSIFDAGDEAFCVSQYSIHEFLGQGGKITIVGELKLPDS